MKVTKEQLLTQRSPRVTELVKDTSKYVAKVIRDKMEGFHVEHLTDEQMRQLNPIIRNAVCTALYALENYSRYWKAKKFVDGNWAAIPPYWEDPVLDSDLKSNYICRPCKHGKHKNCLLHSKSKKTICNCLLARHPE
jgi:hypothetical protein